MNEPANNGNNYSKLSMAEFRGRIGAKIETIEADIVEVKASCTIHNQMLQKIQLAVEVLVAGSGLAKETEQKVDRLAADTGQRVEKVEERVLLLEAQEKHRITKSNRLATLFGAIGGAVLSFISHFVSSWLSKPR